MFDLFIFSYSDESPLIPNEFLQEPHVTAQDLGGEAILGLMLESEPDLWIRAVPSHVKSSLKEKQVLIQFISNMHNVYDTFFGSNFGSMWNDKRVFMNS